MDNNFTPSPYGYSPFARGRAFRKKLLPKKGKVYSPKKG
jgi:hypothetical protein